MWVALANGRRDWRLFRVKTAMMNLQTYFQSQYISYIQSMRTTSIEAKLHREAYLTKSKRDRGTRYLFSWCSVKVKRDRSTPIVLFSQGCNVQYCKQFTHLMSRAWDVPFKEYKNTTLHRESFSENYNWWCGDNGVNISQTWRLSPREPSVCPASTLALF